VLSSIEPAHPALRGAATVQRCEAGQRIDAGALRIDVLRPLAADYAQPRLATNAASCVLRVSLGPHRLLLTGDVPAREEGELVARERDLNVDWLSVPHHGSRTSSSEAFLAAVKPQVIVISAGAGNRYGVPHPEIMERYQASGACVLCTAQDGAVEISAKGRFFSLRTSVSETKSD
jgi:competence protein ComEC